MQYMGSKNRISKYIVPIIQDYIDSNKFKYYVEPFVGGANIIDKIKCQHKIGNDINPYLIALLNHITNDITDIPDTITEQEYINVRDNKTRYSDWYIGLVGFCATFGTRFFQGYARSPKTNRDIPSEAIRNIKKQSLNLKDIKFICNDYINTNYYNSVIYCDPPYKGTKDYGKKNRINYDDFYDWCIKHQKRGNIVLVSEYFMPEENFKCIWEKHITVSLDSLRENGLKRTERLWVVKE